MSTGTLIADRYQVEELVGHGTYGRVFRGIDRETGAEVALKEFPKSAKRGDGFLREIGVLFELTHPNIIQCTSLAMEGQFRYLVYEYMSAGSLRDQLEVPSPQPSHLLMLLRDAACGVAAAHQRNIIHRDLKPENILLSVRRDRTLQAKVSDFGVASFGAHLAQRSAIGSPAYMAPEQFYDVYDQRVDIYAIGVMLYEIVCGRRPFYGSPAQLMMAHIKGSLKVPEWVPPLTARVLRKALAKTADKRFTTVTELITAMDAIITRDARSLDELGRDVRVTRTTGLAATRSLVLVAGEGRVRRYDLYGRLVSETEGDRVIASHDAHVIQHGEDLFFCDDLVKRRLGTAPHNAHLALSRDGALALVANGGVAVSERGVRSEVLRVNSGVTAACFVGPAQTLCFSLGGPQPALHWSGSVLALPEPLGELWGHPTRNEVLGRSAIDPGRLILISPGRAVLRNLVCSDFSCDGENFVAATEHGELAAISVRSGRVAKTKWEHSLAHVAACSENLVWVTRDGHLRGILFEGGAK